MHDCIFCKIAKNISPQDNIIYSNEFVCAFLDIAPITTGHTIVIPREHYSFYEEIPDNTLQQLARALKLLAPRIVKSVNADAYNLGMNNGKEAGQVINHAHLHIIPRFKNDGLGGWKNKPGSADALRDTAQKIKILISGDI